MKLSWLRSPDDRKIGLALFFGQGRLILGQNKLWKRSCELCFSPAILWCESHALYLCGNCIDVHAGQIKHYEVGLKCALVAVSNKLNPERAQGIHRVPERVKAGVP